EVSLAEAGDAQGAGRGVWDLARAGAPIGSPREGEAARAALVAVVPARVNKKQATGYRRRAMIRLSVRCLLPVACRLSPVICLEQGFEAAKRVIHSARDVPRRRRG